MTGPRRRRALRVTGVVQGVGFRPFVARLAAEAGLGGAVGNDDHGVWIDVEGEPAAVVAFEAALLAEAPPLARVDAVTATDQDPRGTSAFTIAGSTTGTGGTTLVPPDVAPCAACLAEVDDPTDRRFRHPFANCTDCGPRYTVLRALPYDRARTTMAEFVLCPACAAEYEDPADRRHHAQPLCCPACGPRLRFVGRDGAEVTGTDPVLAAVLAVVADGGTVAVKGVGGYHLVCDATSSPAVARLRRRKQRGDKPFAVMVADVEGARALAHLDDDALAALASPARPIVLAPRRPGAVLAPEVAPGNPLVGLLVAPSPLHHLLFRPVPGHATRPPSALVATSGNVSDEPICTDDAEAQERLAGLADAFCLHDRPIAVPCDDSVVRARPGGTRPVRRSRGYAPLPVDLPVAVAPTLAVGGDLKNVFCLAAGRRAWLSAHVGDLGSPLTTAALTAAVTSLAAMVGIEPEVVAVDAHPGYLSGRWARARYGGRVVTVQHHHAHVAALAAETGHDGPVVGVAFDGTGHGVAADGRPQAWGGEVLVADLVAAERVGHLRPLPLPGGDAGVRNPCRVAAAWLAALGIDAPDDLPALAACTPAERSVVAHQVATGTGVVTTTSVGRLVDVAASVLGLGHRVDFEAQAAMALEAAAARALAEGTAVPTLAPIVVGPDGVLDPAPLLADLVAATAAGAPAEGSALAVHRALADAVVASVVRLPAALPVALTGGVFQNVVLAEAARRGLEAEGRTVLEHAVVPPNDGGLALGQAVVAGHRAMIGAGGH